MTTTITTRAPATLANLGSGFDVLGLAIYDPCDRVSVRFNPHHRIRLTLSGEGARKLPRGPENVAVFVCEQFCQHLDTTQGVDIDLHKGVPISSGIGSSAASSVATLKALNHLFDMPLSDNELVELAMQGEAHISGALHADNVAPSLLGGLVLVADYDPLTLMRCPFPDWFQIVVAHPRFELPTARARAVLPESVPLTTAVQQWGHLAALIASLHQQRYDQIARWFGDLIIEPARQSLIPGFSHVQQSALDAGALCCTLSGGGPSLFALTTEPETATAVGKAMQQAFAAHDLDCRIFQSTINSQGTCLV